MLARHQMFVLSLGHYEHVKFLRLVVAYKEAAEPKSRLAGSGSFVKAPMVRLRETPYSNG